MTRKGANEDHSHWKIFNPTATLCLFSAIITDCKMSTNDHRKFNGSFSIFVCTCDGIHMQAIYAWIIECSNVSNSILENRNHCSFISLGGDVSTIESNEHQVEYSQCSGIRWLTHDPWTNSPWLMSIRRYSLVTQ